MTFEEKIIEVDNDPAILSYRFEDQTPIWLTLRFLLRIKYLAVSSNQVSKSNQQTGFSKKKLLKYLWHCFKNNPHKVEANCDIISIANFEGNNEIPNRMTFFLKAIPQLKSNELLYSPDFKQSKGLKNSFSFDYFYFKNWLLNKITRKSISEHRKTEIDTLIKNIEPVFSKWFDSKYFSELKNAFYSIDLITVKYKKSLKDFFEVKKPKLVLCSEGNNGDWQHSILFSVCNELSIPTAEVQHGAFNLGMKFGAGLVGHTDFKKYKSNFLFTFGKYHSSQTNVSAECIPLGHYSMELQHSKLLPKNAENKLKKILFICEGNPPTAINNGLINTVHEALKRANENFELILRLHPSEDENEKYNSLLAFSNTRYSNFRTDNIYQLISDADVIISHASTVIYECLYFGKVPFVLEDAATETYISKNVGIWFSNAEELLKLIESKFELSENKHNANDYWQTGGVVNNFLAFWNSKIN